MRIASPITGTLFGGFDNGQTLSNMVVSDTRTIDLPEGFYDILFFSGSGNVVDRQQTEVGGESGWNLDIKNNFQHELVVGNHTGRAFTEMYFATFDIYLGSITGGDFIADSAPVKDGTTFRIKLPYTQDYEHIGVLVIKDSDGAYYIHYVPPLNPFAPYYSDVFDFKNRNPATNVTLNYGGDKDLCSLKLLRYEDPPAWRPSKEMAKYVSIDILEMMNHSPLKKGDSLTFNLEPGNYYVAAYDCSGNLIDERQNAAILGMAYTMNVSMPCKRPGTLKIDTGNLRQPQASTVVDLQCNSSKAGSAIGYPTSAEFTTCSASSAISASELTLDMCYECTTCEVNNSWELQVGALKIDPDGYVYNAQLGLDSKIQGATVTCESYDEDYQTWALWPAGFYENQLNPQVTASDGYYAFFVPPGLYRLWASAPGFQLHTSPNIQVINDIVHYNIPLSPTGSPGMLFLPIVRR